MFYVLGIKYGLPLRNQRLTQKINVKKSQLALKYTVIICTYVTTDRRVTTSPWGM